MTVPIGICSVAHLHAEVYAPILAAMDDVEFVGVAGADDEAVARIADANGTEALDPDVLFERSEGVVVCSENAEHRRWIQRAADAGVDVLSEKPLAPSLAEAEAVREICRDAGVELGVAMPLRFSPSAVRAREAFESGDIGDLFAVSGTNRGEMPGGWFTDPERAGGGAIMDHTVHIVDLVQDVTGERVVEVYAAAGNRFHDLPVEDVNVLSMELSDGSIFQLDGSWSRPDEWPTWGGATLELVGTSGTVAIDCFAQTLTYVGENAETDTNSVFWGTDPNEGMIGDFAEAVRTDRTPETSGEAGVAAVAVVEAAYESVERGEPVDVPDETDVAG